MSSARLTLEIVKLKPAALPGCTVTVNDRVRVVCDIPGVFRPCVLGGTPGTVLEVRPYGTVVVRFDTGRILGVCDMLLEAAGAR